MQGTKLKGLCVKSWGYSARNRLTGCNRFKPVLIQSDDIFENEKDLQLDQKDR